MAKTSKKAAQAARSAEQAASRHVPTQLRRAAGQLLHYANTPFGREIIATLLVAVAAGLTRSRTVREKGKAAGEKIGEMAASGQAMAGEAAQKAGAAAQKAGDAVSGAMDKLRATASAAANGRIHSAQ